MVRSRNAGFQPATTRSRQGADDTTLRPGDEILDWVAHTLSFMYVTIRSEYLE